ncbi:hypothetical protein [Synechococcus sp. H70.2]|uniref:hypothetical protein n=1 Tax=Synechococcus sp. H70.2 TaxID=2964528 RepID=UPI0039C4C8F0
MPKLAEDLTAVGQGLLFIQAPTIAVALSHQVLHLGPVPPFDSLQEPLGMDADLALRRNGVPEGNPCAGRDDGSPHRPAQRKGGRGGRELEECHL